MQQQQRKIEIKYQRLKSNRRQCMAVYEEEEDREKTLNKPQRKNKIITNL